MSELTFTKDKITYVKDGQERISLYRELNKVAVDMYCVLEYGNNHLVLGINITSTEKLVDDIAEALALWTTIEGHHYTLVGIFPTLFLVDGM